jgi:deoxycytidylate deaminase/dephospho-CoA kinase
VFGLTGAFGSGCSSLAQALAEAPDSFRFRSVSLSGLIEEEWRRRQTPNAQGDLLDRAPTRKELQDLGDSLRHSAGTFYWVEVAKARIDADRTPSIPRVVIECIRNPGEARFLREKFRRFFLIAVDAPLETRWERLQATKGWAARSRAEFISLSSRDTESPEEYGQQVQQCVDAADYVITNDEMRVGPNKIKSYLLQRASDVLSLAQGDHPRHASNTEYFMHLAYSASSQSACIKRNVGAVVVRPSEPRKIAVGSKQRLVNRADEVVSIGYNENPDWMQPCYIEYEACFKDIWMKEEWERKINLNFCPYCGITLKDLRWPYRCPKPSCNVSLLKTVFPERGMTHCTAIHAEVRAIRNARGQDLSGCHLYSTTFPCFLCAEEIAQSNIARIVFVDPYPDARAEDLLIKTGVELQRFDGVKNQAYMRFFQPWRTDAEVRYAIRND